MRAKRAAKAVYGRIFQDRPYVSRSGYFEGYRRRGHLQMLEDRRPRESSVEVLWYRDRGFSGKVCFDIGAHCGSHTAVMARSAEHVFAFEPEAEAFADLSELIRMNRLRNVTPICVALGDQNGISLMATPTDGEEMTSTLNAELQGHAERPETVSVPVVTLDDVCSQLGLPLPDFVKIDVEGFEDRVLSGGRGILARSRPEIMVEVHGIDDAAKSSMRESVDRIIREPFPEGLYETTRPFDDNHYLYRLAESA